MPATPLQRQALSLAAFRGFCTFGAGYPSAILLLYGKSFPLRLSSGPSLKGPQNKFSGLESQGLTVPQTLKMCYLLA